MPGKKGEMNWQQHKQKKGLMMLIFGILVLANFYWKVVDWAVFIGAILVIVGILKISMK